MARRAAPCPQGQPLKRRRLSLRRLSTPGCRSDTGSGLDQPTIRNSHESTEHSDPGAAELPPHALIPTSLPDARSGPAKPDRTNDRLPVRRVGQFPRRAAINMIVGAAAVRHQNASSNRHAYQERMDHMDENELSERRRSTWFDARRGLLIGKSRRRLRIAHIEVGSRTTDEHASACIAFVC
jgi:hypothetical protein